MSTNEENPESLKKLFQDGLDLFNMVDKTNEPTNSFDVQLNVKRAMTIFENATKLASMAGLFSTNETIDEVATEDLQYLLLPAFLGTLSMKLSSGDRKEIVNVAEVYFKDFLQRCNDYGLSDYSIKDEAAGTSDGKTSTSNQTSQLKEMVMTRQNKIQRFKQQKELQAKIAELKNHLSNTNVDDEIKRNYMLTMIKLYIYKSIEDLESIEVEKPMLAHMEELRESQGSSKFRELPKQKPLKPVIITKDEMQKAVFGLGYPSFPTMTVQEFYDQRVRDGIFPNPNEPKIGPMTLQEKTIAGLDLNDDAEEVENEQRIENDDPEMLQRLRDKDEFKDDHRRGWGNRMNRS